MSVYHLSNKRLSIIRWLVVLLHKKIINPTIWVTFTSLSCQECGQGQEVAGDWRTKIISIDKAKIQIVTVRCRSARRDKSVQWEEKNLKPVVWEVEWEEPDLRSWTHGFKCISPYGWSQTCWMRVSKWGGFRICVPGIKYSRLESSVLGVQWNERLHSSKSITVYASWRSWD